LADALDALVPEGPDGKFWPGKGGQPRHIDEGSDDMPAHVKSSLMGPTLVLPISRGGLALGTWQGLYLNEHRDHGGGRTVLVTLQGQLAERRYGPPGRY